MEIILTVSSFYLIIYVLQKVSSLPFFRITKKARKRHRKIMEKGEPSYVI